MDTIMASPTTAFADERTIMTKREKTTVVFPGTFDPITNGHLDVIKRGSQIFDELVVAVGDNPEKASMLSHEERAAIVREVVADMPKVRVETYKGLTVDLVRRLGASAILRGIRSSADLHFEYQTAATNRAVAGVETVFIMTSSAYAFTSSSLIRQIASMGGDVSALVPPQVVPHIKGHSQRADPNCG